MSANNSPMPLGANNNHMAAYRPGTVIGPQGQPLSPAQVQALYQGSQDPEVALIQTNNGGPNGRLSKDGSNSLKRKGSKGKAKEASPAPDSEIDMGQNARTSSGPPGLSHTLPHNFSRPAPNSQEAMAQFGIVSVPLDGDQPMGNNLDAPDMAGNMGQPQAKAGGMKVHAATLPRPPNALPKQKGRKKGKSQAEQEDGAFGEVIDERRALRCTVQMLDGTEQIFAVLNDALAGDLFLKVCEYLNIEEKDYFSMTFYFEKEPIWIDHTKKLTNQLKKESPIFEFRVKFYPSEPLQLQEDLTKYYLTCQVRQDIITGKLPCSFLTYAILGAYNAQADLGDWDPTEHGGGSSLGTIRQGSGTLRSNGPTDAQMDDAVAAVAYLSEMPFAPSNLQTFELLERISELHRSNKGMTPEDADNNYLDNAKKLAFFGLHFYPAKDNEGVEVQIGVNHSGIVIYRGLLRVVKHSWYKVIKLSYLGKRLVIRRRPHEFEAAEVDEVYKLENHKMAKRAWNLIAEHHSFFRLREPEAPSKPKFMPRLGTMTTRFQYTGRTQYQAMQEPLKREAPSFKRSQSHKPGARSSGLWDPSSISPQHSALSDPTAAAGYGAKGPGSPLGGAASSDAIVNGPASQQDGPVDEPLSQKHATLLSADRRAAERMHAGTPSSQPHTLLKTASSPLPASLRAIPPHLFPSVAAILAEASPSNPQTPVTLERLEKVHLINRRTDPRYSSRLSPPEVGKLMQIQMAASSTLTPVQSQTNLTPTASRPTNGTPNPEQVPEQEVVTRASVSSTNSSNPTPNSSSASQSQNAPQARQRQAQTVAQQRDSVQVTQDAVRLRAQPQLPQQMFVPENEQEFDNSLAAKLGAAGVVDLSHQNVKPICALVVENQNGSTPGTGYTNGGDHTQLPTAHYAASKVVGGQPQVPNHADANQYEVIDGQMAGQRSTMSPGTRVPPPVAPRRNIQSMPPQPPHHRNQPTLDSEV